MLEEEFFDSIVVGGGLGGLAAAQHLLHNGARVLLLEAADRVGGRTHVQQLPQHQQWSVDVGAQWIGPLHTRVSAIAQELGIEWVEQYAAGADLLDDGRTISRSVNIGTNVPRVGPIALLDLQFRVISAIQRKADALPPLESALDAGRERDAQQLAALDAVTSEAWLRKKCWTSAAARLGALCIELLFGCQPSQVSMLQLLQYVRANGGITFLTEVKAGAQERWAAGGAGRIAPLLLARLRERHGDTFTARLGCPVVGVSAEGSDAGGAPVLHAHT